MIYFDKVHAINVHDSIIEISGGSFGFLQNGEEELESVLVHVQNDDYYPTFSSKLTHLVFSINKDHAFTDGNKRSSIALGSYFLIINGYIHCVGKFIVEMENISVSIAKNEISKKLLEKILKSLIEYGEISEEIKLEILKNIDN